jgi:hypothetical protein
MNQEAVAKELQSQENKLQQVEDPEEEFDEEDYDEMMERQKKMIAAE